MTDSMSWDRDWLPYKPLNPEGALLATKGPSPLADREPSCIICLADLLADEDTKTHSTCKHVAHATCIEPWLAVQRRKVFCIGECPMCRQPYSLLNRVTEYAKHLMVEADFNINYPMIKLTVATFNNLLHLGGPVQGDSALLASIIGVDQVANFRNSIIEWCTTHLYRILRATLEAQMVPIKANAVNALLAGVPWVGDELADGLEPGVWSEMLTTFQRTYRKNFIEGTRHVKGLTMLRRSLITTALARYPAEIAAGKDENVVRAEIRTMFHNSVAKIKQTYLDLAKEQYDVTMLLRKGTMMDQQREYFLHTGYWTPEEAENAGVANNPAEVSDPVEVNAPEEANSPGESSSSEEPTGLAGLNL